MDGAKLGGKTRKLCRRQDKLLELWENNWNDCRIAGALGVTSSAVWQWRRKNGLPRNCERGRQW